MRTAVIWSAVAIVAAAFNLAAGTACCNEHSAPPPERSRPLTKAMREIEPNDDDGTATSLVEAREEIRTRFAGSCADGTRDVFVIASSAGRPGVACEIRSSHGVPPLARLRAPELGIERTVYAGRIELATRGKAASVYLDIPCTPDRSHSSDYFGWITSLDDAQGYEY